MRLMSYKNLARPNRLYRGIAVFLLIFSAIDLASFVPCQEDGLENFPDVRQAARTIGFAASIENPAPDQQPDSQTGEHDCFCCCTHLAPVEIVRIADLSLPAQVILRNDSNLLTAPPPKTYRPPRLA